MKNIFDLIIPTNFNFQFCYTDYCWKCPLPFCTHNSVLLKENLLPFW